MNFAKAETRGEVLIRLALLAKVGLVFAFAFYRPFVVDELWQAGQAKYLFNGLYDTIWPAKAAGYALFYKIAHLIGWDTVSIMLIARGMTALLGCATLSIVYFTARSLGADRLRALLILLVLLSFSNFAERIFRTRAEPLSLFFAASALLVIVRARSLNARALLFAGVLSGCAFLTTQKAIYFNFALGLGLAVDALWQRQFLDGIRRGTLLVAGWTIPIIAYSFLFGGLYVLPILQSVFFGPQEIAVGGHQAYSEGLRHFVWQTLERNAALYLLCGLGMVLAIIAFRQMGSRERIALVFSITITVLVFAHNQPWPYVFIMALPFMALWTGRVFDLPDRLSFLKTGSKILLIAGVALSFLANLVYFQYNRFDQGEVIRQAEALLAPHDQYFDGIGSILTRMDSPRVWLDERGIQLTLAMAEQSVVAEGFQQRAPKLIIETYRTRAIEPLFSEVAGQSYTRVGSNIMIAGRRLGRGAATVFDVPIAGRYRLYNLDGEPATGGILIDGQMVQSEAELARGKHRIELVSGPGSALLLPVGAYRGKIDPDAELRYLFFAQYN